MSFTTDWEQWQEEQDREWEFERKLIARERFEEMPEDQFDSSDADG